MDLKEKLINEYPVFESRLNGNAKSELHKIRLDALNHFKTSGFPTKKLEEWRFTDIKSVLDKNYNITLDSKEISKEEIKSFQIKNFAVNLIVLVNGKYSDKLSEIRDKEKGVIIKSFRTALKDHSDLISMHFAKHASITTDGFTAINTAYTNDGVFISVPENSELKHPVYILNITDSRNGEVMYNPRHLIVMGENSKAQIIEIYYSLGEKSSFSNVVTEIYNAAGSDLRYYKIQNEGPDCYHVGTTQVKQEKNSRFFSVTVSWGGGVTRNNLNSLMNGENIECIYKGLYYLKGNQHLDNHTLADHATPNCHSNELYKGILDGNSDGVFNGKIMVRKDAQKTNAYQMNNNILLSNSASINSKPQLEIYADDVKCSHGATTGQLDDDQLFYLRARGIGAEESRKLLLYAFANEIVEEVNIEPLKMMLEKTLKEKLDWGVNFEF